MANKESNPQATIPFEDLSLFKFTHAIEIPYVNPVTYWVPRRHDIQAIGEIIKSTSPDPLVLDIGCGNAFISHLLAEEVPVIGLDPNISAIEGTIYKHPQLKLLEGSAEETKDMFGEVDAVVNSWMPNGIDFSDALYALNPKVLVFVLDRWSFTGGKDTYKKRDGYEKATSWIGLTSADLRAYFNELCQMLEPHKPFRYITVDQTLGHPRWNEVFQQRLNDSVAFSAACNKIDIWVRSDISVPGLPIPIPFKQPYAWEGDLEHVYEDVLRFRGDGKKFSTHAPVKTT